MDHQEQNTNILKNKNEFGENRKSPPSTNSTYLSFNNLDSSQSVFEHNGLNRDISDPSKFLDLQCMLIDQGNAVMTLKMSEYEKSLAERDNTIKSLHTDMMNSQYNNHILTNQCKNLMEKTKLISHTCLRLNTSFENICDRLNKLGTTVENAKIRQKDVTHLVDQATNTFKEKILNISGQIEYSLNQEKIRGKQELEILENKYSLDMIAYKSKLEESTKNIEDLKSQNNLLLEKLNETNIKLNEEKETILKLNQNHEKVLKEINDQNVLLITQNNSLDVKYEEILQENQYLKDKISMLKISLDENKKQLDMQLTVIKEQTALLDNLKITEELNNALKEDNFSLKEHNNYLEKNNATLMEDINKIKLSHKDIQKEKEIQFKDMCKEYDDLLKIQEEKLIEKTKQLHLQIEKECKMEEELVELKQLVDVSNNTIYNLKEELKNNNILIPDLQNKIDDLNTQLANANQELQDKIQNQENITQINELKKEKSELENQIKENFKQIEKLTFNYTKYKSKAKQLYVEVMRLRFKCSPSKPKNTSLKCAPFETIELASDENDNCDVVEFNDKDIMNIDVSIQSTSHEMKRNSSPLKLISNSKVKKLKTSNDNISSRVNKEYNQDLHSKESKTQLNEKYDVNNESINQFPKKQNKSKPTNIQNVDWFKPNSPVDLVPAPKQCPQPKGSKN